MAKKINYATIIEAIFAVIIGQNTLMMSRPIVSFSTGAIPLSTFFIFASVGIINTLTMIANWQQSKETENRYNKQLFVWDILALAEFALFTQVLYDCFDGTKLLISEDTVLAIFCFCYIAIYGTFILWNKVSLRDCSKEDRGYIKNAIRLNAFVIISLLFLLVSYFYPISFLPNMFVLFILCTTIQLSILVYYFIRNIFSKNTK